ncbi:hypothetical protein GSY69_07445 [Brevibacterium sp. 5221]|uniref:Polyketide cyclase n=1 Tax=Brevibacterium rongguiense TaxID=2695267 RepID=A0A6N9H6S3_9MICO|nr:MULTISPECIES: SRPBCC family protein [Brevibacterium]MYM19807.1 hypothetical protein [Brevibacterium rongguiense]WAL40421.1 SRPBCC family protein [Brevibacterium sp. BRM-1]
MLSRFRFSTRWHFAAAPAEVWAALADLAAWPQWWPGIAVSQPLAAGDARGLGRTAALTVRTPLGADLRFELTASAVRAPEAAVLRAVGDLSGTARVRLRAVPATASGSVCATRVDLRWDVESDRVLLALARPAARLSHGRVMAAGQRGLAGLLSAR